MSSVTLVRHGQASYMSEDYDRLSPLGEEQAVKLGRYWVKHGIVFDYVFHGPAQRHRRTMEIAAAEVKGAGLSWPEPLEMGDFDEFDAFTMMRLMLPALVRKDERVRTLHEDFEASRQSPEAGRKLQKLFEEAARNWAVSGIELDGCESWPQFRARIKSALYRVRTSAGASTRTVVFTSGGPIAASVAHVLELRDEKAIEFVWLSRNASYAQLLFSLDRSSLHAFNAIPHLDDLSLLTYR